MSVARPIATAAVLFCVVAVMPGRAGAHSTLLEACPAPGEITRDFDTIQLTFETELAPVEALAPDEKLPEIFVATDDGRTDLVIGPTLLSADSKVLTASVPEGLAPGLYIVRYEAVSVDADLNDGGFVVTYDPDATNMVSCGQGEAGGSGSTGGLVLLGIGVVALGAVGFLLRPRRSEPGPAE